MSKPDDLLRAAERGMPSVAYCGLSAQVRIHIAKLCLLAFFVTPRLFAQTSTDLTQPPSAPADKATAPPVEFSDKLHFTVAGITDWTAVGGHGSDATLRTSEEIARATASLKDAGKGSTSSAVSGMNIDSAQEKRLRTQLAADPGSYLANRTLGELYLKAARYRDAEPLLERAASLRGGEPDDEYQSALACQGLGDAEAARKHVVRALSRRDDPAFHRLAGALDEELGDPLGAVEQNQKATHLDPSEENYFAWASELLLHRAIWQAAEVFSQGVRLHPQSARLRFGWGAALFAGARYGEAAQHLCEASDLEPSNRQDYLVLGEVALSSPQELPCAQARMARFLTLRPDDAKANYYQAMLLLKLENGADVERATRMLERSAALAPTLAEPYLELGILAASQHRAPDAMAYYRRAIAADTQLAEAHYRLGVLEDRSGDKKEAKRELALHEQLIQQQAAAIERQRSQVKQFLVVLDKTVPASTH